MSRWRVFLASFLIGAPFLALAAIGSFYLWRTGLSFSVWWPMAASMILGYVLAWHWQRNKQLLRPIGDTPPLHWTSRDLEAWKLVEERARRGAQIDPAKLSTFQFYIDTAEEMALQLARFFYPRAKDPIESVTIPEILAVVELASRDLGDMVDKYLPGGHLLTLRNWRQAQQISDWYRTASNVYWVVAALFSPVNTALRYATSQAGISRPLELLQQNLLLWFYTAFVHRTGTYLIDLNSGRLRVGADRYRQLQEAWRPRSQAPLPDGQEPLSPTSPSEVRPEQVGRIVLTVVGQVKSGKSSFVNALLGEQRAVTDVLPATEEVTRYELQPSGVPSRLVVNDTVGYAHTGPREDQLRATEEAARQSDLIILIVHARNPAREADLRLLRELRNWFGSRPDLKMPPILGVMTHIDLLSPAMEWSPPYNWIHPERAKEHQIQQAWEALKEQLGEYLVGIVPLCTEQEKVYGMNDWFLPTLTELLDEAHAVALLRCIRAEADTGKVRRVFEQLLRAGQQAGLALWHAPRNS
jgi:predicted GTPase